MTTARVVPGPPDQPPTVSGGDSWFWVDLPGLRQAYLDAGFTEHHRVDLEPGEPSRVVLMTGTWKGQDAETLVPVRDDHHGWGQQARTALALLERIAGRPRPDLGAITEREAELWRVIVATRTALAPGSCTGHVTDADGNISHRDARGKPDLFEQGRCEMRSRVSDRLEHVLAGEQ